MFNDMFKTTTASLVETLKAPSTFKEGFKFGAGCAGGAIVINGAATMTYLAVVNRRKIVDTVVIRPAKAIWKRRPFKGANVVDITNTPPAQDEFLHQAA